MLGSRKEIYLLSILLLQALIIPVFAEEYLEDSPSVILETDKPEYQIGDSMIISGLVEEKKMPVVALKIFDPSGGILSANQVDIEDDDTFSKTITLDSPFYDEVGTYSISADYGKLKTETNFDMISEEIVESISEDDFEIFSPEILVIFTDKEVYEDGDTVTIIGLVSDKAENSVLIGIYDPFGTPAGFYFADVDSNYEFSVSFLVKAGVNFKTEGTYSISAFYGDSEESYDFDFVEKLEVIESEIIEDDVNDNKEKNTDEDSNKKTTKEQKKQSDDKKSSKIDEKIVNDIDKLITAPTTKTQKSEDKKTSSTKSANNLSVEDIELGIMLNQINLRCDTSEFVDTISYYDSMGPALIRLCKYDEAIYYYDQSLLQDPDNVEILTNKGSALAKMGFHNEAIVHYNSALAIDPDNFLALNNKANSLANLGKYEDAISFYDKALLFVPNNAVVLKNLEKANDKLVIPINEKIQEPNDSVLLEHEKNMIQSTN